MTIVLLFLGLKDPQDWGLWALKPEISRADEIEQISLLCPLFFEDFIYIFLLHHMACGILALHPGIELRPSAEKARSLNHQGIPTLCPKVTASSQVCSFPFSTCFNSLAFLKSPAEARSHVGLSFLVCKTSSLPHLLGLRSH